MEPSAIALALHREVALALPGWVEAHLAPVGVDAAPVIAMVEALVLEDLRTALLRDVDTPGPNPLAIVRRGVGPVSEALRRAGVEPVRRDPQQTSLFPDDVYDLSPASFADLSAAAGEAAIVWGAARAHTHLSRRHPMSDAVGFVPDLMDRSKLVGVRFVPTPTALAGAPETVVVLDLARPGTLEVITPLVAAGKRVVGFVGHVERDTIARARDAGAEVHPRSELFRRWPDL